jgi:cytochrome c oxidase subunit 4
MATDTENSTAVTATDEHALEHADGHDHPTEAQYWKIFFILFAITAVEVLLYYVSIPGVNLNNAALLVLAAAKFVAVVGYFMHLKFDNRILRRLFVTGLVLAAAVYIAYLLTMGVFLQPPNERQQAPQSQG